MLIWKKKQRPVINDDDLRAAVMSRNQQSNADTWEIVLTIFFTGLIATVVICGMILFRAEIHDLFVHFGRLNER